MLSWSSLVRPTSSRRPRVLGFLLLLDVTAFEEDARLGEREFVEGRIANELIAVVVELFDPEGLIL
jgi:hypothetical protein